jgi:PRTRC genetic system protein E
VFVELVPLLKDRTVLMTVASIDGKLKVNLIPTKTKEGEQEALTTPLSFTGSAEELDAELGGHFASYVHSHVELHNTLAEAKAEMDAAAKAARQRVKTTQQAPKSVRLLSMKNLYRRIESTMRQSLAFLQRSRKARNQFPRR